MSKQLVFNLNTLRPILAHAVASKTQRLTETQLCDPALWKEGAKPTERGWVEPGDVDQSKVGPALWIVNDAAGGIGITSSGDPPQYLDAGNDRVLTAWAVGFDPERDGDCSERARALTGGVAFTEWVDAREVLRMMEAAPHARTLRVRVSRRNLTFVVR